jgi:hypothetical protein
VDLGGICNFTINCDPPQRSQLRGTVQCEPLEAVVGWGDRWTTPPAPDLQYPFTIHRWFYDDLLDRSSISGEGMDGHCTTTTASRQQGARATPPLKCWQPCNHAL